MSDLKSFSVGHTAKGAIWWQAWPFDGEPRKGTADTIGGALVQIGVAVDAPAVAVAVAVAPDSNNLRERYESACHRENQAFQRIGELQAINGEQARTIADLMAENEALRAAVDACESAMASAEPAPQAADKAPSCPAAPRKPVKASKGPSAVQDGPMADADPVGAYLAEVRRG
jgi:hypothetical protein